MRVIKNHSTFKHFFRCCLLWCQLVGSLRLQQGIMSKSGLEKTKGIALKQHWALGTGSARPFLWQSQQACEPHSESHASLLVDAAPPLRHTVQYERMTSVSNRNALTCCLLHASRVAGDLR